MDRFQLRFAYTLLAVVTAASPAQAADPRIVNEGGIRDEWKVARDVTLAAPGYPAAFASRGDNVCVAIGYRLNADGTTSDFQLLRAWASSTGGDTEPVPGFWESFAQAGALALAQWRFAPRPEITHPKPVYTVATMTFMGKQAEDGARLRSHCTIADLTTTKAELERDAKQRTDINKHQLDKTMNGVLKQARQPRQ